MRCEVTNGFDFICCVGIVRRWVGGELFMGLIAAVWKSRMIWGGRGENVYKLFVANGEQRRDVE